MTTLHSSLLSILVICTFLSGCATKPPPLADQHSKKITWQQRANQLTKYKAWQLQGKIAFIQQQENSKERKSAAIFWRANEDTRTQTLNLTSYLGINVLHLQSNKNQHLIKVDGKEYRDTNLSRLINSLTGFTLPTQALAFWLKGLKYNNNDKLEVNSHTQLPQSISSEYNNILWKINYNGYQTFNGINMATKLTIKKDDLLIKFAIKKWTFNE